MALQDPPDPHRPSSPVRGQRHTQQGSKGHWGTGQHHLQFPLKDWKVLHRLPTTMAVIINILHAHITSNQGLLTTPPHFWDKIVTIWFVSVTSKVMKLKKGTAHKAKDSLTICEDNSMTGPAQHHLHPCCKAQALAMDATGQCPDRCTLNRNLALTGQWNCWSKRDIPHVNTSLFQRGGRGRAASHVLMEKNLGGLLCDRAPIFTVSPNKLCSLNSAHWDPTQKTPVPQLNKGAPFNLSSSFLWCLILGINHLVKAVRTILFSQYWGAKFHSYIWVIQVVGNSRLLISSLSAAHSRVKACSVPGVIHTFQRLLAFSLGSSVTKHMLRLCTTLLRLIFGLKMTGEHRNYSSSCECLFPTRFLQLCGQSDSVKWTPLLNY